MLSLVNVRVLLQIHVASAKACIGMMGRAAQQLFALDACLVVLLDLGKFLAIALKQKWVGFLDYFYLLDEMNEKKH